MPTDLPIMLEDYKRHMPKDGDLTLHVLKGHLVIEQYMTAVIEKVALNPRHLSKANLNFSQKVALTQAFSGPAESSHIWDVLRTFNKIRNELVHNLPRERLLKLLQQYEAEFKQYFKDRPRIFDEEHVVLSIHQFVLIVLGAFDEMLERLNLYGYPQGFFVYHESQEAADEGQTSAESRPNSKTHLKPN